MPEASMYEYCCAILWKYQIRGTRKMPRVEPISEAKAMQALSDQHFGLCVLTPYSRHHPASGCGIHYVRQQQCPEFHRA